MVCGRGETHGRCGGGGVPRNNGVDLRDPRDIEIKHLQQQIQKT